MNNIAVSRVSCSTSLLVYVLFFSACDLQPVSIDRISRVSESVAVWMDKAKASSQELTDSIGKANKDLAQYLNANNLSDETIKQFENKKSTFIVKLNNLRGCESNIKFNSNQLFLLLKKRTEENTTPYLKERMSSDIEQKERAFGLKLGELSDLIRQIEVLIKKYDDLLGFLQVRRGLGGIAEMEVKLDECIREAQALKIEILAAIAEGEKIINSIMAAKESR